MFNVVQNTWSFWISINCKLYSMQVAMPNSIYIAICQYHLMKQIWDGKQFIRHHFIYICNKTLCSLENMQENYCLRNQKMKIAIAGLDTNRGKQMKLQEFADSQFSDITKTPSKWICWDWLAFSTWIADTTHQNKEKSILTTHFRPIN